MQAKRTFLPTLLVSVMVAVLMAACSGGAGGAGKTWFNLPSVPLNVKADGTADVYGIGLGAVLTPDQVQLLQSLGQKVELRAGYNGIHVYVDGQDLPYLAWDDASASNLQTLLKAVPGAAAAADNLPWLRRIGLGAAIKVPPAQGAAADIPRWRGETSASPQQPASVIGPIALGVSFDESGNGSVLGLTSDQLAALTGGVNPVALDANTLALLKSLGVETLVLKTTPGGLNISLNGQPLPGVAYDGNYISRTSALLSALTGDAVRMETVEGLLPQLTNMDATITLDFTGQPAEFQLAEIPVAVAESGALTVFGLDIPGAALPADTLQLLADANIQQVGVNASKESINLAVNGQVLPQINLSPAGLNVVANLVGTQAGISPQLVTTGVDALLKDGLSTTISLPGASGEVAAPGEPSFTPADLGDMAPPVIRAKVGVKSGQIASVGDLTADQLAALGVALPALPPNVMQILGDLNAKQVDIVSQPNALQINVNAEQVASIKYDQASLQAAFAVAKPFLKGTLLENPGLSQLIEDQILPLVPAADINVQITIE